MITVLHRGGMPKWLQYYIGKGVSRAPQKWLRNMCTTPYGGMEVDDKSNENTLTGSLVWEWKNCSYFDNSLIIGKIVWEGKYCRYFENEITSHTLRVKIVWEWKYCPYFESGAVSLLCYPLVTVYQPLRSAPTRNMNFKKCKVAKSWRDCAIDDNENIFLMTLL